MARLTITYSLTTPASKADEKAAIEVLASALKNDVQAVRNGLGSKRGKRLQKAGVLTVSKAQF